MAELQNISVESSKNQIIIRFTNPEERNPLSISVLEKLDQLLDEIDRESIIIFTGSENVFASGANLNEIALVTGETAREYALRGQDLMRKISELPNLTIAFINGFCFGGGVTWQVAVHMPELLAAVPFYGPHPDISDVPAIQAAVMAVYGELDSRINGGIPAIEEAMAANNKIYEKVIYPNADHAFHNDSGTRYNPEAATDAWKRTLAWFETYVRNA